MRIFSGKFSIVMLNYKNKRDEIEIALIPARKGLKNNRPIHSGRVRFQYKKGRLRTERFWLDQRGNQIFFDPKRFISLLRDAKQILIPKNVAPPFAKELREMFRDYQINLQKVKQIELCKYCLFDDFRITELGKKVYDFQDERVCLNCARNGLIRELQYQGVDVSRKLIQHMDRLLKRAKSVDKVLGFLASSVSVKQPSVTLYDVIPPFEPPEEMRVSHLDLPQELKNIWQEEGIDWLLPAQVEAIKAGLLKGEDLLIVSATSSGKTLIGEFAGVNEALKGKVFCFLVPLVALSNQLYEEFRRKYSSLGLRVAIRVGMSNVFP
ncbi:MAG: DEAD/DEAH box helicase, partial [Promethearchaeota archaeon]